MSYIEKKKKNVLTHKLLINDEYPIYRDNHRVRIACILQYTNNSEHIPLPTP